LYINKETGFVKADNCLPGNIFQSGKCIKSADFDNDGDPDLFIGGRVVPGQYPLPATSYILRNNGASQMDVRFEDVTGEVAPDLLEIGLVTDAVWDDFDSDGDKDLIIVGEWMKIHFFENISGTFKDITDDLGFKETVGWWFSVNTIDMDKDGDNDYVIGNLGLNQRHKTTEEEPFFIYANDFNVDGQLDIVLGYVEDGKNLPLRGLDASGEQIPAIKLRFESHEHFAGATLEDIYGEQMLNASLYYKANTFKNCWIENKGEKNFEMHELPNMAQFSSINDIAEIQKEDDDITFVVAGNFYDPEVETPRSDASVGLIMNSDTTGKVTAVLTKHSRFIVKGETKVIERIKLATGHDAYLFAINNDSLKLIEYRPDH
jgi:hypothetical protein